MGKVLDCKSVLERCNRVDWKSSSQSCPLVKSHVSPECTSLSTTAMHSPRVGAACRKGNMNAVGIQRCSSWNHQPVILHAARDLRVHYMASVLVA